MVRDGLDGLHAPVGDPAGLAEVMCRAVETDGLWERLVAGIRPPPSLAEVARQHHAFYQATLRAEAA